MTRQISKIDYNKGKADERRVLIHGHTKQLRR